MAKHKKKDKKTGEPDKVLAIMEREHVNKRVAQAMALNVAVTMPPVPKK